MPKKKGKLIGKDGTFLMPHLYTSFTRGCKLGVECGIKHFCSHLLLSWYYFVIYLSKIGTIPVFRPVTHAWPAASKLPDNAICRCLLYSVLGIYVRSSNLASLLAPLIKINPQKNKCKNKTIN